MAEAADRGSFDASAKENDWMSDEEKWKQMMLSIQEDGEDTEEPDTSVGQEGEESETKGEGEGEVKAVKQPDDANDITTEDGLVFRKVNIQKDESNMFLLPQNNLFLLDMNTYRGLRKVNVYPFTQEDMIHPNFMKIMNHPECLEYRIQSYRAAKTYQFTGIMTLYMATKEAYEAALVELKEIRRELTVEGREPLHQKKLVPMWNMHGKEASGEFLRNHMVCISNKPAKTTEQDLEKYFPTALDIHLPEKKASPYKKFDRNCRYAYAYYSTPDEADAVIQQYKDMKPVVHGQVLGVHKYRVGGRRPEGMLSLTERMLVLRHGTRAANLVNVASTGEDIKAIDLSKYKLKKCTELINVDNKMRKKYGLSTPSYKTLVKILPAVGPVEGQEMLRKLRVLPLNGEHKPTNVHYSAPMKPVKMDETDPDEPLHMQPEDRNQIEFTKKRGKRGGRQVREKMAALGLNYNQGGYGGGGQKSGRFKRPYGGNVPPSPQQQIENLCNSVMPLMTHILAAQQQQQQQQQNMVSYPVPGGRGGGRGKFNNNWNNPNPGFQSQQQSAGQWKAGSPPGAWDPAKATKWVPASSSADNTGGAGRGAGSGQWNQGSGQWNQGSRQWTPTPSASASNSSGSSGGYGGGYNAYGGSSSGNQYGGYEDPNRKAKFPRWS